MRNSIVLPVLTSVPTSTLRSVTTPAKGARTLRYPCISAQPPDVGLHGGDVSLGGVHGPLQRPHVGGLGLILRLILIVLLFGDRAALHQIVPARGGDLGDGFVGFALFQSRAGARQVCLRLYHGGLRLPHLLIQVRRLHFGQKLAGGNAVADVHIAALDVAFGPRQDRRFRHGLNIARQHQVADGGRFLCRHHGDIGQRVILHVGFGDDLQFPPMMRNVAHEERRHKDRGQPEAAASRSCRRKDAWDAPEQSARGCAFFCASCRVSRSISARSSCSVAVAGRSMGLSTDYPVR